MKRVYLKRTWAGDLNSVTVLVTIGVPVNGKRQLLSEFESAKEVNVGWSGFMRDIKKLGLTGASGSSVMPARA